MKVDVYQGYLYDDSIPKDYSVRSEVTIKGNLLISVTESELKSRIEKALTSKENSYDKIKFNSIKLIER